MDAESKALTYRRWHQELHNILIERGLVAVTQKALLQYFKDEPSDDVLGYLELLLKEDKAQKFRYKRDIYWRATTRILDED